MGRNTFSKIRRAALLLLLPVAADEEEGEEEQQQRIPPGWRTVDCAASWLRGSGEQLLTDEAERSKLMTSITNQPPSPPGFSFSFARPNPLVFVCSILYPAAPQLGPSPPFPFPLPGSAWKVWGDVLQVCRCFPAPAQ